MQGEEQVGVVLAGDRGALEEIEVDVLLAGEVDLEAVVALKDGAEVFREPEVDLLLDQGADGGAPVDPAVTGVEDDDDLAVRRDVRRRGQGERPDQRRNKERKAQYNKEGKRSPPWWDPHDDSQPLVS